MLPCWLNPAQSAEALEVTWSRGSDAPIVVYRERKTQYIPSKMYGGRLSFGSQSPDGLASGDVSLKLHNVTIEDGGGYTCYVSSEQEHDHVVVQLNVTGEHCEKLRKQKAKEQLESDLYIKCILCSQKLEAMCSCQSRQARLT